MIDVLGELNPQIALFTETMLKSGSRFEIDGYTFCGRNRDTKSSGGVGILVNNEIKDVVTPHETQRDIEMVWVSVRRRARQPVFIGVYYGLQESRNSRNDMLMEMDRLGDEIQEKKEQGEVILFMDGNGKIGLLGEEKSRNGKLLQGIFDEYDLEVMNKSEKCDGIITRVNRKNTNEKSAIDFLVVTNEAEKGIQKLTIDEKGEFLLRGTAASDHNSFLLDIQLGGLGTSKREKVVRWRLNAPVERWKEYRDKLEEESQLCSLIMQGEGSIENKYTNWKRTVERAAIETIGKTTFKNGSKKKESGIIRSIRNEKKEAKKAFESEECTVRKPILKEAYIEKQKELRGQIEYEESDMIDRKFKKMMQQGSTGFWKEMKRSKRDTMADWISVKDENGDRILDPDKQKKRIAKYYENLYSFDPDLEKHDRHSYVKDKMIEYHLNREHEDEWQNQIPCKQDIAEVIQKKKNQKATTDFPNELLKRGGKALIDCLYPVIEDFWEHEQSPKEWNQGIISSIYKGKGDREKLQFQRGITVSSAISMTCEEIINKRLMEIAPLTQAQGGGRKGSSTRDHVFLLRGAIMHAIKNRMTMFVTYFDVTKAYDRADVEDMLIIIWEKGLKGKLWRLLKSLNTNLTAKIKTRHGLTQEIPRKAGGKQGGKNFGFLFAKMMDILAEKADQDDRMGVYFEELRIAVLEWVDDVATFAIGKEQQIYTLDCVNKFAIEHKLKWGKEKCNVMEVGTGVYKRTKWNLGKLEIESCSEYKYLGDWIRRDGKNTKNIDDREIKVMAATRKIVGLCGNNMIQRIELTALLKLHETCTLATLLTNSETWTLNQGERQRLQKIELWALKKILNVPITTPTPAIWFATGFLLTPILIDRRQLIYLKTLLDRPNKDWTKQMLYTLDKTNIGWASHIKKKLIEYQLETSWENISKEAKNSWKNIVETATEKKNRECLIDMCYSKKGENRKTVHLLELLKSELYVRKPLSGMLSRGKRKARIQLMSMSGMLDCAANFKHGYGGDKCRQCGVTDNEDHRINNCSRFKERNLYHLPLKV